MLELQTAPHISLRSRAPDPYGVVHTMPDGDALVSAWLLDRFVLPTRFARWGWRFAPFNFRIPNLFEEAAAIADIGGEWSPSRLRFDHHQLADPRSWSATTQVFSFLTGWPKPPPDLAAFGEPPTREDLRYLRPIVDVIHAGDTGQLEVQGFGLSTITGLHAQLGAIRAHYVEQMLQESRGADFPFEDDEAERAIVATIDSYHLHMAFDQLDRLETRLRQSADVRHVFDSKVLYRSPEGDVWALQGGAYGSVGVAFERGAKIVINTFETVYPRSVGLEIWAARSFHGVNMRRIMHEVAEAHPEFRAEIARLHQEERFAVRGGQKAPDTTPVTIDLCAFGHAIWEVMYAGG